MKDPDAGRTKWPGISQHDPHFPKRTVQYIAGSVGAIKICNLYNIYILYIHWNMLKHHDSPWYDSCSKSTLCFQPGQRSAIRCLSDSNCDEGSKLLAKPVGLGPGVCITWIEPTECDECASDQVAIGWKQVFAATYIFSVVYAILISVGSSKQVVVFCHYFAMPCLARLFCGWLAFKNAKMSRTCWVQKGALDLGLHRLTTKLDNCIESAQRPHLCESRNM